LIRGLFNADTWIGQAGLNMGARFQSVGISCLIVDKNDRVGDNWRNRYRVSRARVDEDIGNIRKELHTDSRHSDTGYPRSSRIHTHGLPAFPTELAAVHTEGQTWRLV
jgi:cation diffusion facilitator CzcD-associated flavoprotein CzcO